MFWRVRVKLHDDVKESFVLCACGPMFPYTTVNDVYVLRGACARELARRAENVDEVEFPHSRLHVVPSFAPRLDKR